MQFYDASMHLPAGVASLPVRGANDVELRYTSLQETKLCALARSHCDTNHAVVNEAVDVFYEALMRLRALELPAEVWAATSQRPHATQRA